MSKVIVLCGEMMAGKTTLAHIIADSAEEALTPVSIIDYPERGRFPMAALKKHLANPDNLAVVCCYPHQIRRLVLKLEPLDCELQMWSLQPLMARNRQGQVTYGARTHREQERTCVHCGCTDSDSCPGGCSWAEKHKATNTGVCSNCTAAEQRTARLLRRCESFIRGFEHDPDQPGITRLLRDLRTF